MVGEVQQPSMMCVADPKRVPVAMPEAVKLTTMMLGLLNVALGEQATRQGYLLPLRSQYNIARRRSQLISKKISAKASRTMREVGRTFRSADRSPVHVVSK